MLKCPDSMNEPPDTIKRVEISVVIPAYREAENLEFLLPRLLATLDKLTGSREIIVVDAPTPLDSTPALCAAHGVRHIFRQGGDLYGHAVRTGIAVSHGSWVVLMDADGSHDPEFITELWQKRDEADLVIASRYVEGGVTENSRLLIWMSHAVNRVFRFVLGLGIADVSNSFRLYNGDHLRTLQLGSKHFDIVEEILVKLAFGRRKYRILEIPAAFRKRQAGTTKRQLIRFAFGYLVTLSRLWLLKVHTLATRGS